MGFSHSRPKFEPKIMEVAAENITEKTTTGRYKGSYGYPFVSKRFFYKITEFKSHAQAKDYLRHVRSTRKIYPSKNACHALSAKLVEENFVIAKYKRYPMDLFQARNRLSFEKLHKIMLKVLHIVIEMHSLGVNHCDIKPENILVSKSGEPVLCDLTELAQVKKIQKVGTQFYAPPEGLLKEALHLAVTGQVSFFTVYSFIDLFALGKTVQQVFFQNIGVKQIHFERFWSRIIRLFTSSNVEYFFNMHTVNVRASDCYNVMRRFGVPYKDELCDCAYRTIDYRNGCHYCHSEPSKMVHVRSAESIICDIHRENATSQSYLQA